MSLNKMLSAVVLIGTLSFGAQAQSAVATVHGPANQYKLDYQEDQDNETAKLQITDGREHAPTVLVFNEAPAMFRMAAFPGTMFLVAEVRSAPFQLDLNGEACIPFPVGFLPEGKSIYAQAISVNLRAMTVQASNALAITGMAQS